jgi:hypothetical protein
MVVFSKNCLLEKSLFIILDDKIVFYFRERFYANYAREDNSVLSSCIMFYFFLIFLNNILLKSFSMFIFKVSSVSQNIRIEVKFNIFDT